MIAMILAGGTGTRLWPYSRSMTPKQFLNLGSTHESLFQETCKRLETLVSPEQIYVVGSDEHVGELRQQMLQMFPDYRPAQLLIEPLSRNTDRKSTRLNSSHKPISYAVFCWKKKKRHETLLALRRRTNS